MTDAELAKCTNAILWADEWLQVLSTHPDFPTDRNTMITWFSNAIQAGFDDGYRRGVETTRIDKVPRSRR